MKSPKATLNLINSRKCQIKIKTSPILEANLEVCQASKREFFVKNVKG